MFDYYPQFTNVTAQARRQADELERATIARADLLIYPTSWAARSAIEDYGADPAKVHVQPYGANIAETPSREMALAPRRRSGCKLIFVGVDWSRKGGAIALEAVRCLRRQGLEAELTILGCIPREPIEAPAVTVIPFLDKNDPAQRDLVRALYLDADFLILPTRSECYGIVFCEAAAHGLPSITAATGGVPDVVRDGINGYTLPTSAGGADYAALIREVLQQPGRHDRLRESSRMEFERRLNWDVWGRETARLVAGLLDLRAARSRTRELRVWIGATRTASSMAVMTSSNS
jgi:glycosyltransferase involved in cell wall biosynthesis